MIQLDEKQTGTFAEWIALDADGRIEQVRMGNAASWVKGYREVAPFVALIELLHGERPREADGSWPAEDIATARQVAERWLRDYKKEDDEGARRGEVLAKSILEQLGERGTS